MSDVNFVKWPWFDQAIPVDLAWVDVCGKESEVLAQMQSWTMELKRDIEGALFASYLDKIHLIDAGPGIVPFIPTANDVWDNLTIKSVSPHFPDVCIIYAVPDWDFELQHEWCIKRGRLVYVGQVLCYEPNGYEGVIDGNYAKAWELVVKKHLNLLSRFV